MAAVDNSNSVRLNRTSSLRKDGDLFEKRAPPRQAPRLDRSSSTSLTERNNGPSLHGSGAKTFRQNPGKIKRFEEETISSIASSVEDLSISTDYSPVSIKESLKPKIQSRSPLFQSTEQLNDPLPHLESALDELDLKECAYEILVSVTGPRSELRKALTVNSATGSDVPESIFSKALWSRAKPAQPVQSDVPSIKSGMEIILEQMGLSDTVDERIRKGLSKAPGSQAGKKLENLITPLELLQHLAPSDFPSQRDYLRWRRRQLAALEQGLVFTPASKGSEMDEASKKLREALEQVQNGQLDLLNGQGKLAFRVAVLGRTDAPQVGRGANRWANGYPFNVLLYRSMLKVLFELEKPSLLIDRIDDVLELLQKVWPVLGIGTVIHHAVFAWVLFQQFVDTGCNDQILVSASFSQVEEAIRLLSLPESERGDLGKQDAMEKQILCDFLGTIQSFVEKRLFAYQESFPLGGQGIMEHLVGLTLLAEDYLQSAAVQGYQSKSRVNKSSSLTPAQAKVELYIQSSVKGAFALVHEQVTDRRRSFKGKDGVAPVLVSLAVEAGELVESEVSLYSPAFKRWYPSSGGLAAAVVHGLFATELKQFVTQTKLLTQEAAQVLLAADRLEKQLVQVAVEDGEDCEDGGASSIRKMAPFEAEAAMQRLLNQWVEDRMQKFREWVDKTIEKEQWDPNLLSERHAVSAVDVSQLLKETVEAFFELPLPPSGEILVKLSRGMEAALEIYCSKITASIGSKESFIPAMPNLTRYKKDVFVKAQLALGITTTRKPGPGGGGGALPNHVTLSQSSPASPGLNDKTNDIVALPRLCCRINTAIYLLKELDSLMELIRSSWESTLVPPSPGQSSKAVRPQGIRAFFKGTKAVDYATTVAPPLPSDMHDMFSSVKEHLSRSIGTVADYAAYKIVFKDMRPIVSNGLYMGGVSPSSRMPTVTKALSPYLISIVDNIVPAGRDPLVGALLKALSAATLRVLLAAGPGRAYTFSDAAALKEDLEELKDLFVDGGEGLPEEDVNKATLLLTQVLRLFFRDTDYLIKSFDSIYTEWLKSDEAAMCVNKDGKPKLPPTKARWSADDPNTLLRVLCYRADRKASKYLKKLFDVPKEVRK